MKRLNPSVLSLVRSALDEDIGRGDVTSLAALEPDLVKGVIIAKSEGVLSGSAPAIISFQKVDSANKLTPLLNDGDRFRPGDTIIELEGLNQTLLTAERTALNFLAHLSGVATLTRRYVDEISGSDCRILDTRKTTPGFRHLEKQAVRHGGGENHRFGLYDMVLIKDNHIAAAGSISAAVDRTRDWLASADYRIQFDRQGDDVAIEVDQGRCEAFAFGQSIVGQPARVSPVGSGIESRRQARSFRQCNSGQRGGGGGHRHRLRFSRGAYPLGSGL
jgi:nicotinate-nucleotide pyrophosphorylase